MILLGFDDWRPLLECRDRIRVFIFGRLAMKGVGSTSILRESLLAARGFQMLAPRRRSRAERR